MNLNKLLLFLLMILPVGVYANCPRCNGHQNNDQGHPVQSFENHRNDRSNYNNPQAIRDGFNTDQDRQIAVEIRHLLLDQNITRYGDQIRVIVNNGRVVLSGRIENQEAKDQIEEAINRIWGVENISLNLTTTGEDRINNQLRRNNFNPRGATIYEKRSKPNINSRDLLSQSNRQRRNAYNSESKQDAGQLSHKENDQAIEEKINDELKNKWFAKNFPDIEVMVRNGNITLRGPVENRADIDEIMNRIQPISGNKNIRNEIQIISADQNQRMNQRDRQRTPY